MKKRRLFNSVITILLFSLCSCGNQTNQRDDGDEEETQLPIHQEIAIEFSNYEELIADIDIDNKDDNFFIFNPSNIEANNKRYFKAGIKDIYVTSHLALDPYYPGIFLETSDTVIVFFFYSTNNVSNFDNLKWSEVSSWYINGPEYHDRSFAVGVLYNYEKSIFGSYFITNDNDEQILLVEFLSKNNHDYYKAKILDEVKSLL